MNWLQKLLHAHQWKQTYTYASLKDSFANPPHIDNSGTVTIGQECTFCGERRSEVTTYAKDGSIARVTYHGAR